MSQLKTDWVRIATEGATFRNVPIERQWLVDIAETYDPKTYGARIWPDHRRWYGAWGDVIEVKTEEHDGKLVLFGKLNPNSQFIMANENDQKVYTSIELDPNFAATGKAYLTGLGVTDEPASLGTDRLKFGAKERLETHQYGAPEQLVISYPAVDSEELITPENQKAFFSIVGKFFKSLTPHQINSTEHVSNTSEEEPMTKEQHEALMGQFASIGTRLESLEAKTEAFSVKPPETEEEQAPAGEPQNGITAEQFSTLNETLTSLTAKVDGMETQFKTLSQETGGQEPDPAGLGEQFSVV
ncbi:capsid scaffolding [Shewanella halifaxensis HAW-EB4]|uniref:Capsid scaffolding n=1 Tax=Shewanella halifaxensis (strain HAW-EB4) TaxID=458817 RepID=B0TKT7_SHEHH|nr:GPO family capsid scaffolding protein [Shewanella halifaxensis]ABZ75889.1 capsid scaffolding [Shewanella halifaxensis HAW-EB4]